MNKTNETIRYASLRKRLLAGTIDAALLIGLFIIASIAAFSLVYGVAAAVGTMTPPTTNEAPQFNAVQASLQLTAILVALLSISGAALYLIAFESKSEKGTIGARVCGIRVVTYNKEKISATTSFIRLCGKLIYLSIPIIWPLGPLAALWISLKISKRKQTLYDFITKTIVIDISDNAGADEKHGKISA